MRCHLRFSADNNFSGLRTIKGLGSDIGPVKLENGSLVDGGRVLMRYQWNWESYLPLKETRQPQDIWINKNIFFAPCVGGSLQDDFTKG